MYCYVGVEREFVYIFTIIYEMMKEEEKRSLILYITEKCEKPEKTSCYSVLSGYLDILDLMYVIYNSLHNSDCPSIRTIGHDRYCGPFLNHFGRTGNPNNTRNAKFP